MKHFYTKLLFLFLLSFFGLQSGFGQTTIYSQGFETDLNGYSHTPSQMPSSDPGDQYFHRAEPNDSGIYEGSVGPYTNVTGSWLFVGSAPNAFNGGNPGILTLGSGINVNGFTDLELSIDFGAVPNDWDNVDNLSVEYSWNNSGWFQLYSFGHSNGSNDPLVLSGNASGGSNTANGTILTYALQTITSDNFTGSGTTLYLRVVCDSGNNYEAFGLDNVALTGVSASGNIGPSITNIINTPLVPSSSQSVVISAEITDADGIATPVNLNWGTASGNLPNQVTMTNTTGDTYEGTIPSQSDGTTVFYQIEATDSNASPETTTSTEQSYTVQDPFTLPFTEDFATGLYSVTLGGVGSDGVEDYFFITDGSNIDKSYTGTTGNFFAGQDIDDGGWTGSTHPSQLTWENIDINSVSNIDFSCDFASVGGGIDSSDSLLFEYRVDGGSWIGIVAFENSGGSNNNFFEDTNFDGTGDGIQLTNNFATFTKSLSVSGSTLDIRFTADVDSGDEDFAIDDLILSESCTAPADQATAYNTTNLGTTSATLNWTRGTPNGGDNVLVIVKEGSAVDSDPVSGTAYTANTVFGNGDELGTGNFVVYYDPNTDVSVTGLNANTTYHVAVYEYNNTDTCYLTPGLTGNFTTLEPNISLSPTSLTNLDYFFDSGPSTAQSFDISGTNLDGTDVIINAPTDFEISDSQNGAYLSSITLTTYDGTTDELWVRLETGKAVNTYTGNITTSGGGDTSPPSLSLSGDVSTNSDSDIDGPGLTGQPDPVFISSLADTGPEAIRVFDFDVYDFGSGDGLPTTITQVTVDAGTNNDVDWSTHIENVKLSIDGGTTFANLGTVTINVGSLVIPVNSGLGIADGDAETVSLYIYLKNSGLTDNGILEFTIPTSHGFTADASGSTFATNFSNSTTSNEILIDVVATELSFGNSFPLDVDVNSNFSLTVNAIDANGNLDLDSTESVTLSKASGSGNLSGTLVQNLSNGTFDFSDLQIDEADMHTISTSSTLTDVTSGIINVVEAPSLIITEVADPGDDFDGRFVEIYNNGDSSIDLGTQQIHVTRQANGGGFSSVALTGTLKPDHLLVIGNSSNINTLYGFNADVDFGDITGNGDDGYFIYYNGDESTGTLLDAYGVVGQDGTGQDWEYEDSRAIRNNPKTVSPTATWNSSQWTITAADVANMTPGELENEFRYKNGWLTSGDPSGVSTVSDEIKVVEGTAVITSATIALNTEVKAGAVLDLDANLTSDILFKSDDSGSAQLADATGATITGEVTVERYIPANRAYRLLSSPVTTSGTIFENWQENGIYPTSANGIGTHITGFQGTVGQFDASSGLDQTASGNPSMFTFDNVFVPTGAQTQFDGWDEVASTNQTGDNLIAETPYLLFVRGDRSIDLASNSSTPNNTTLSATGNIFTGLSTQTLSGQPQYFSLVANPFQAIVDFNALTFTGLGNPNFMYVYDPAQKDYVTLQTGTNDSDMFIRPGQSVFVVNSPGTATASTVQFEQTDINTSPSPGPGTTVFSDDFMAKLELELYNDSGELRENLRISFEDNASNAIDEFDAPKLTGGSEILASVNSGNIYTIERRTQVQSTDQVSILLDQYQGTDYEFRVKLENWNPDVEIFVADNYLGTTNQITPDQAYVFTVDSSIPESISENRFSLVFDNTTLGVDDNAFGSDFALYPNPTTDGQFSIKTPNLSGEMSVEITSLLGQNVYSHNLSVVGNQVDINAQNLSSGIYVVKLTQENQSFSTKLIVE